jgi:hypothetical protein
MFITLIQQVRRMFSEKDPKNLLDTFRSSTVNGNLVEIDVVVFKKAKNHLLPTN